MSDDLPEVTARDAIQIAQRALAKVNELERSFEELQADYDDLHQKVTRLELRHSGRPDNRDYPSYTLDEKVGMVREHAFEKASSGTGYAKLDYDDVMWSVFDGDPSTKHCYKLLRLAAEGLDGFEYREPSGGTKHLHVDANQAKRNVAFFPGNKAATEGQGR